MVCGKRETETRETNTVGIFSEKMEKAFQALREGRFVLLYDDDDRERETDFVIPAINVRPEDVRRMRKDGGGLICVAVGPEESEALGLPFAADVVTAAAAYHEKTGEGPDLASVVEKEGDLAYDRRSSFSLWLNHRENRTGIPDDDRSLTIRKLGEITEKAKDGKTVRLSDEFRTPGHTATLRAADGLLKTRRGQTELSIALAQMAGITPAMVVCEMLDDNGKARSKDDAKVYGAEHDMVFLEGKDVEEAYDLFCRST